MRSPIAPAHQRERPAADRRRNLLRLLPARARLGAAIVAVISVAASACAMGPKEEPTPHPAAAVAADEDLLQVLLYGIYEDPPAFLRVDPRLLTGNPNLSDARASHLAAVPEDVIEERAAALQRMGVRTTDAIRDSECGRSPPGGYEPGTAPDACPAEGRFRSIIFGLPREGGPHWPFLGIDEREDDDRRWTIRSIERLMAPTGSSYLAVENIVRRDPGSGVWRLVERRSMIGD